MSEVLQANIFFYIASVATVIFCIVVTLILFQFYKILKTVHSLLERIDAASEVMAEDVAHLRGLISNGGFVATLMGFILGSKKKRSRRAADDE